MKVIRYYHSKPTHIVFYGAITDSHGDPLFISEKIEQKKIRVPRVTVASILDTDKNTISFGTATCSPKDVYLRKEGNRLALSRALSCPEKVVILKSRKTTAKDSQKYAHELMKKHLPSYVSSSI